MISSQFRWPWMSRLKGHTDWILRDWAPSPFANKNSPCLHVCFTAALPWDVLLWIHRGPWGDEPWKSQDAIVVK